MTPRLTAAAWADVIAIADAYDEKFPGGGDKFFAAVDSTLARVAPFPRAVSKVARPPRGRDVRVLITDRFPFKLVYEITASEIVVVAVYHAKRRTQPWRRRLA